MHLRTILVGAAVSAPAPKAAISEQVPPPQAGRGALRAALAIAHKILVAAYHMLVGGLPYRDLGEAYLDRSVSAA